MTFETTSSRRGTALRVVVAVIGVFYLSAAANAATYVVPPDDVFVKKTDVIAVARALTSYVEESPQRGIETVTVLSIADVLKGNLSPGAEVTVRVIGGVLEKKAKLIPGAPRFTDGKEVLVFLSQRRSGDYAVTDFGLGLFEFSTDDSGRRVVVRQTSEINGWTVDGKPHQEQRRDADRFLTWVRGVARGLPMNDEYHVEPRPLIGDVPAHVGGQRLLPAVDTPGIPLFTRTQYTLSNTENDLGFRWNVFPSAVNWNRGNAQPGASNSGIDAINAAFAAWNGDTLSNTNYVLATSVADTDGIEEDSDLRNNIVFEKDIIGAGDYSCASGGLLGVGGISLASSTHMLLGESFFTTTEGDVSMNRGVGACIGGSLSVANYNSSVTHEFGHTLGFRHSDQNRVGSAACSTQPTYDCANVAIMTAFLASGLNATLQTWDQSAVRAVYPGATGTPPAVPTGVVATAVSSTSVSVSWSVVVGATSYEVYRRAPGGAFTLIGTPATNAFTDNTASPNTAYLYRVRSVGTGGTSADSAYDLATTVIFTDDPLVAGVTVVKAIHLAELRTAVNAVRAQAGQGPASFTDSAAAGVIIKAVHITELRNALDVAMSVLGLATGGYTDTSLVGVVVKAIHFQQLRNRVK